MSGISHSNFSTDAESLEYLTVGNENIATNCSRDNLQRFIDRHLENVRNKSSRSTDSDGYEAARNAYIKLTNKGDLFDGDTGECLYVADKEIMEAFEVFFGSH